MKIIDESWCPGCGHYLGWSGDNKYRVCGNEQCPYFEGGIPVDYMPTLETKILEVAEKIGLRGKK